MKRCNCTHSEALYNVGKIIKCQYCDGVVDIDRAFAFIKYNGGTIKDVHKLNNFQKEEGGF